MQKVTTVNLMGRAYQLEEGAYDQLRTYLDEASAQLDGNPDRAEILSDFERAIAEKCDRLAGPYKVVVTAGDMRRVLAEMGPVVTGDPRHGESAGSTPGASPGTASEGRRAARRLYRLPEGKAIAGVCTGLAAYLGVDVTIVRVAYIVAFVVGFPWAALFYIVPMLLMPEARSPEDVASAHGEPFNAREVIEQAKRTGQDLKDGARRAGAAWRRHWRRERRRGQADHRALHADPWHRPPASRWAGPFTGLIGLAWIGFIVLVVVSSLRTHALFGWPFPAGIPVWVGLLALVWLVHLVLSPFLYAPVGPWGYRPVLVGWWHSLASMIVLGFAVWLLYRHMPSPDNLGDFLRQVPAALQAIARDLADWLYAVAG